VVVVVLLITGGGGSDESAKGAALRYWFAVEGGDVTTCRDTSTGTAKTYAVPKAGYSRGQK
jgi:hypothetical protein